MSDFVTLRQQLADRGFDALAPTRLGLMVNQARQIVDGSHLFPYREMSATGAAPLVIPDLDRIESVTNEDLHVGLVPGDFRDLVERYGDLSLAGDPVYFYVAWPSGVPEVATYPESSSAIIGVQYWRVTPDLVADSDVPLAPPRFHGLIVDVAVQRAYLDRDNLDLARALQGFIDQRMGQMVDQLLGGQQLVGPQRHQAISFESSSDW